MTRHHLAAPGAAVPVGRFPVRARALGVAASSFTIVAITLGTTAGALLWGTVSLLGLGEGADLAALLGGVAAALPVAGWLAARAYRAETDGQMDGDLIDRRRKA